MGITKEEFRKFEMEIIGKCAGFWGIEKLYNSINVVSKINCIDKERYSKIIEDQNITLPLNHVELLLNKGESENIMQFRKCDVGAQCFQNDTEKRFWHGNIDGKWTMGFTQETLKPNDEVKAKYRFFTDFKMDIDGKTYEGTNNVWGYESPWSEKKVVPEAVPFWSEALSPVHHCHDTTYTSSYGNRTFWWNGRGWYSDYHTGVDIAKGNGCNINSVYDGAAKTSLYAGNTVEIDHQSGISTRYGHLNNFNGRYPRSVITGEIIGYMGCTGSCEATHLHFETWEGGTHVSPLKYFKKQLEQTPGFFEINFYNPNL